MPKYYFYKMTADNGGAPCVENGLLSLAICKPEIRSTAKKDDIILGFAAKSLSADNRLIYVARVTAKIEDGDYFKSDKFSNRSDCIYRWTQGHFIIQDGAKFHRSGANLQHDLGKAPKYVQANVLLSCEFSYFGANGTADYKREFRLVAEAVEKLKRGHRVKHASQLLDELQRLATKYSQFSGPCILGKLSQQPPTSVDCCLGVGAITKQKTQC
jgi:hypothetical protein